VSLVAVFKTQIRRFNHQDRQIHIKAILKKLTALELECVSPNFSSKLTLNQILGLCGYSFSGESIFDLDNSSLTQDFQKTVKYWIDSLDQQI